MPPTAGVDKQRRGAGDYCPHWRPDEERDIYLRQPLMEVTASNGHTPPPGVQAIGITEASTTSKQINLFTGARIVDPSVSLVSACMCWRG